MSWQSHSFTRTSNRATSSWMLTTNPKFEALEFPSLSERATWGSHSFNVLLHCRVHASRVWEPIAGVHKRGLYSHGMLIIKLLTRRQPCLAEAFDDEGMVDGTLLVVDVGEGPLGQTKFVVAKALSRGICPILLLNKVDCPSDEELEFPIFYVSPKEGWASRHFTKGGMADQSMGPLFDVIVQHVAAPTGNLSAPNASTRDLPFIQKASIHWMTCNFPMLYFDGGNQLSRLTVDLFLFRKIQGTLSGSVIQKQVVG